MSRSGCRLLVTAVALSAAILAASCGSGSSDEGTPTLAWYVFDEPSGSFQAAADRCTEQSGGDYAVELEVLPADANQQREQLVRRLAAEDSSIDLIGMDVIWTAEFAAAEWIVPFEGAAADDAVAGRIDTVAESVRFEDKIWGAPLTSNTQLLWYRSDRVDEAPETWDEMIDQAEEIGADGTIQAQGQRYEGLTVLFNSLLASAGGQILNEEGTEVSLETEPTRRALEVMQRFATSDAADPSLSTALEDDGRLAFEAGSSSFMVNYPFVYPSAEANAPDVFDALEYARWPGVVEDKPSRVTIGGINIGVGAFSDHPDVATEAAACLASPPNQKKAAIDGGLPPSSASLYEDPDIVDQYPFADLILESLEDGSLRPPSPVYNDVSLAISRTLHPMNEIDPEGDVEALREIIGDALEAKGLL